MSEQDVHAGLAGKPFQQGMNYDDYERGVRLITSRAWRLTAQGEPVSRRAR